MSNVLSGIQSSGQLTIGNYIGALHNYVKLQHEHNCYFMVVDLHAITVPQSPEALKENIKSAVALFVASGVDPNKASIFLQSHVSAHAELGWIMTTLTHMGELERMTQFKDKSSNSNNIGVGLFTYPSLMAADILLYQSNIVPVGDDQKQHLELTRDLAIRFNNRFGETFKIPQGYFPKSGARIMSLDDVGKKMSKSNPSPKSYILMLDSPDEIRKKINKATTDSIGSIKYDSINRPAISNLINIFSEMSNLSIEKIEELYDGKGYGAFKKDLADVIIDALEPIQQKYKEIRDSEEVVKILKEGSEKASIIANQTLKDVKEKMGFIV